MKQATHYIPEVTLRRVTEATQHFVSKHIYVTFLGKSVFLGGKNTWFKVKFTPHT